MAQLLKHSRPTGGRIRDGSRGSRSWWTRLWETSWESLAIVVALSATAYVGAIALSEGLFDNLLTPPRQSVPVVAHFAECAGPARITCVVDGDTFWLNGTKIRIADIDTPEVSNPSCSRELMLGQKATARMRELLNAGPFDLITTDRDEDVYGRALRIVSRNGTSLGDILVREGLAHVWDGSRHSWCR